MFHICVAKHFMPFKAFFLITKLELAFVADDIHWSQWCTVKAFKGSIKATNNTFLYQIWLFHI